MSAPYKSELCHALDPSYANGVRIRPVCFKIAFLCIWFLNHHLQANECQPQDIDVIEEDDDTGDEVYDSNVSELLSRFTTPPIEHM